MNKILSIYKNINSKILKLTKSPYFNEFYCAFIFFIALFSWRFNDILGLGILIALAGIILFLTWDLNFVLPFAITLLFVISSGYSSSTMPLPIVILASVFIVILVLYLVLNWRGFKLKKMPSFWGLLGLAIMNLIPIFWADIPTNNFVLYVLYFANLAYLCLYLVFCLGIKKANLKLLATAFSFLALLLSAQCLYKVVDYHTLYPEANIFDYAYWLGWGLCNEAGIMICFSLPFIFYLMSQSTKLSYYILQSVKVFLALEGVVLTTSRGSYLCAFVGVPILFITLIFISKIKKIYLIYLTSLVGLILVFFLAFHEYTFSYVKKVIDTVFALGFDNNGRKSLYEMAINSFQESLLNKVFGGGICDILQVGDTAFGVQLKPIIFHSTILQTLVMGGIFGLIMLLIHLVTKYYLAKKLGLAFFLTIGLGFIGVDLYGLVDNTYHMYYYMIPLSLLLAVMDNLALNINADIF